MLLDLVQTTNGWVRLAQSELVRDHMSGLIHQKATAVDLEFYESPEYHDGLERVQNDLNSRPLALLESTGSLFQNAITLIAMGALLTPYGVWLPIALLLSTLPALLVVIRFNRRSYEWWNRSTSGRRRARYYDAVLTTSDAAAELRLFDLREHCRSAYEALRTQWRLSRMYLTRNQ